MEKQNLCIVGFLLKIEVSLTNQEMYDEMISLKKFVLSRNTDDLRPMTLTNLET